MKIVSYEEFLELEGEVVYSPVGLNGNITGELYVKTSTLFGDDFTYDSLSGDAIEWRCADSYDTGMNLANAGVHVPMDFSEMTSRMGLTRHDHKPKFAVFSKDDVVKLRDRLNEVIEKSLKE